MTLGTNPVVLDTTGESSPYPYFEYMRQTDPVWHGTFMDQSQLPEELRPKDEWVLFGYDGVFQGFRDDKTLHLGRLRQDHRIGDGATPFWRWEARAPHDHRSLVAKAFRAHGHYNAGSPRSSHRSAIS